MTSIEKFRIKRGGEAFTRADFEESPAWSEHYDYDQLDVIASWGVDRSWVAQQFRSMDTGGAHPNYTILDRERLPHEHMRISLKAQFQHQSGLLIDGYVMNADAFCIGLFIGMKHFAFSRHSRLRSMMLPDKKKAEEEIGVTDLFPLTYQASFRDAAGKMIIGEFAFPE